MQQATKELGPNLLLCLFLNQSNLFVKIYMSIDFIASLSFSSPSSLITCAIDTPRPVLAIKCSMIVLSWFGRALERRDIFYMDFQQMKKQVCSEVERQEKKVSTYLKVSTGIITSLSILRVSQFFRLKLQQQNTCMRPSEAYTNQNKDYLQSLKLKYTAHKNNKHAADHQTFLNSYASLRPNNDQLTDRRTHQQRSPLKSKDNLYQNNRDNFLNLRKSIISKANLDTDRQNFIKERSSNLSLQKKQDPLMLKHLMADRSLPKFRESISIDRPECVPKRKQSQMYINQVSGRQAKRQEEREFKQNDSPIKLIYESKQSEQQTSKPLKVEPKTKSNEITHYYKLQREKTTKTINSIENILASIRNTLNK